ncbi:methionyl-tRNA formyltransferase [Candidatus Uhrbacteria bacterium]|nr:methionyl-tRNA formyltransferase [Candidatus Uhrbacteria bacterium]
MYRILFFGTSDFAVPSLKTLLYDDRFEVVGIVTQPDKPVGRHAVLTAPPVKKFVQNEKFFLEKTSLFQSDSSKKKNLFQPNKLSDPDFRSWIETIGLNCDAFVVIAYGKIIPQSIIDLTNKGVVNVHGSLLPRWRGASPIQAAIAAGDTQSGVTVMLIDDKLDHGPILGVAETAIFDTDTGATLHDRLAILGSQILPDILVSYLNGKIRPREQDHDLATECKTLSREDGKLDFTKTSQELERMIRAFHPWPGTWMMYKEKRLKIHEARVAPNTDQQAGTLFSTPHGLFVACAQGTCLELVCIQQEGKKNIEGKLFLL